ncbi:MAG TPA: hypothetical protein VJT73_01380 [Polyangiaceae bacterium]|nr:hypothetical protein [Polyangiaceae bacterium]
MRAISAVAIVLLGLERSATAQAPPYPVVPYYNGYAPPGYFPSAPPPTLPYQPGASPPPGYHLEENPRRGLVASGLVTFLVPYVISATVGMVSRNPSDRWLVIPVVGPIGALAAGDHSCERHEQSDRCAANVLIVVGLSFDILAQTAGAALFTFGYALPKKEWVSDYQLAGRAPGRLAWKVRPELGSTGLPGVVVDGSFW